MKTGKIGVIVDGPDIWPSHFDTGVKSLILEEFTKRYGTSSNPIWISVDYNRSACLLMLTTTEIAPGYIQILNCQTHTL